MPGLRRQAICQLVALATLLTLTLTGATAPGALVSTAVLAALLAVLAARAGAVRRGQLAAGTPPQFAVLPLARPLPPQVAVGARPAQPRAPTAPCCAHAPRPLR